MNKKRIIMLLLVIAALFTLSGCSIPTDPDTGKYILITDATTFASTMDSENWFTAIFVYPIAKYTNFLGGIMNVGLAVTLVTLTVHALILALTFKANVGQVRMQDLQPDIQKIQKKYEGKTDQESKMKLAQETQAIYTKEGINPLTTILVQFIQFPVIIAMYQAVQRAEVVANGSFLGMKLDATPLAGIQDGNFLYLVLFAVMIVAQFASMKIPMYLTERKGKALAAKQHRKYEKPANPLGNQMYIMIIFISVLAINWPSAMTLYWIISSIVNVSKQVFIHNAITSKN